MEPNKLNVLAIDDVPDNLLVLQAVICDQLPHVRFLTAPNGADGLRLALSEYPDVILLDIVMPDMDGFAVCRKIKESDALRDIPVVFMTAYGDDRKNRIEALRTGADGFLSKPFDTAELVAQIRAMAKVRAANRLQKIEKERLETLVAERTRELAQELAERKRVEEEIQKRYYFERLISHMSARFVNYRDFDEAIRETLHDVGLFTGSDRAYIFLFDERNKSVMHNTHEWCTEGVMPQIDNLKNLPTDLFPWWMAQLHQGETIHVADVSAMPPEAHAEQEILKAQDIVSVLAMPLFRGQVLAGFVGLDNIRPPDGWSNVQVGSLKVFAEVISMALNRKWGEEEGERLMVQLFQSQKMETIGRLAGGVAHDLNNQLTVVSGVGQLLLTQLEERDARYRDIQEILAASQRAANLVRQLLAFARKQIIAPGVLDLNEAVEEMLKMLRRLIGEDIDLAWEPGRNLWPIFMDSVQIEQILANLAVNARDAIAGVGRIGIETENVVLDAEFGGIGDGFHPGDYVRLSVIDDGCGMDAETQAQIFEPFFTTKEVGRGTGLGLSTVYGIAMQNTGCIQVESEPGKGSRFDIFLPRYEGKAGESTTEDATGIAQGHGETVLVVDDEPAVVALCKRLLDMLGYAVLAANSPAQALALAETHAGRVHLLLTDVIMPEMSGSDLAHRIKAVCPDIHVVYMSGYPADVIAHRGNVDEGAHYIQKPFTMENLSVKIRDAVSGRW